MARQGEGTPIRVALVTTFLCLVVGAAMLLLLVNRAGGALSLVRPGSSSIPAPALDSGPAAAADVVQDTGTPALLTSRPDIDDTAATAASPVPFALLEASLPADFASVPAIVLSQPETLAFDDARPTAPPTVSRRTSGQSTFVGFGSLPTVQGIPRLETAGVTSVAAIPPSGRLAVPGIASGPTGSPRGPHRSGPKPTVRRDDVAMSGGQMAGHIASAQSLALEAAPSFAGVDDGERGFFTDLKSFVDAASGQPEFEPQWPLGGDFPHLREWDGAPDSRQALLTTDVVNRSVPAPGSLLLVVVGVAAATATLGWRRLLPALVRGSLRRPL